MEEVARLWSALTAEVMNAYIRIHCRTLIAEILHLQDCSMWVTMAYMSLRTTREWVTCARATRTASAESPMSKPS